VLADGLRYGWDPALATVELSAAAAEVSAGSERVRPAFALTCREQAFLPLIAWRQYRQWDLLTLTQNYLRLMLMHAADPSDSGLLVHCISGADQSRVLTCRLTLRQAGIARRCLYRCCGCRCGPTVSRTRRCRRLRFCI
jgi:hypothetical protein